MLCKPAAQCSYEWPLASALPDPLLSIRSCQRETLRRIEAEHQQPGQGNTAPLLSVSNQAIAAMRTIEMDSGSVAENEPGLASEFVTAAGAASRVGTSAVAIMPLEDRVTERKPFSFFPRAPAIELAKCGTLLEKSAPPNWIGGDVHRRCALLLLGVTRVTWVTALIVNGFSR
jgi:hypothetical protein